MESTGVYWKPVFNILEEHFKVILVNARHIKNVPGRKTDKKDSQWICKLLLAGLLKASFIPEERIRQLRDLNRYSTKLTQQLAAEKNRIQKVLEDANIKLSSVVSDTSGVVATKLIDGLMAGQSDLEALITEHYHGKMKASKAELLKAITGRMTDHHRFMLRQIRHHMAYLESQVTVMQTEIDRLLSEDQESIALLTTIPGVNKVVAVKLLAETGTKLEETFGSAKRLAKWTGICPGNNETGGKKISGRTTHGNKYLKAILVEAAWAATRTKGTYLRAKYNSMIGRKGKKKALLIVGHKILCAAYIILTTRQSYQAYSVEEFERRRNQTRIAYLQSELKELGVSA
jgi:transposase